MFPIGLEPRYVLTHLRLLRYQYIPLQNEVLMKLPPLRQDFLMLSSLLLLSGPSSEPGLVYQQCSFENADLYHEEVVVSQPLRMLIRTYMCIFFAAVLLSFSITDYVVNVFGR